jgi:hypothetical protein
MSYRRLSMQRSRRPRQNHTISRQLRRLHQQNATIAKLLENLSGGNDYVIAPRDLGVATIAPEKMDANLPTDPKAGVIYFLRSPELGAVKIGKTKNLHQRRTQLQTGCPETLILAGWVPGYTRQEKTLHRYFDASRLVGEWFSFAGDVRRYVETQGAKHEYISPIQFFDRAHQSKGVLVPTLDVVDRLKAAEVFLDDVLMDKEFKRIRAKQAHYKSIQASMPARIGGTS